MKNIKVTRKSPDVVALRVSASWPKIAITLDLTSTQVSELVRDLKEA